MHDKKVLVPMPRKAMQVGLKVTPKKEKKLMKDMGLEKFLTTTLAKKSNIFDRKSWIKYYNKL